MTQKLTLKQRVAGSLAAMTVALSPLAAGAETL